MPNKLFQKMAKQFGELDDNGQEWIRDRSGRKKIGQI